MKSALLLTAMLSGLCAEVLASPVSHMSKNRPTPVIQPDLHFNAGSLDKVSFVDEAFPDQDRDQVELVTTGIEFEESIAPQEVATNGKDASGSFRVPEPPPGVLIALGFGFIGVVALWRRARWLRRRIRRRTVVRMRAITAER